MNDLIKRLRIFKGAKGIVTALLYTDGMVFLFFGEISATRKYVRRNNNI